MNKTITLLLTILMSMIGANAFAYAYDIAVENADGVTIYYKYINDGKELEVTNDGDYNSYSGNVVIPEEVSYMNQTRKVTSIAFIAFWNCYQLTSVTIPNSVTSIGEMAFEGCKNLNSVTIGNSVISIGKSAFTGCDSLASVHISDIGSWSSINFTNIDSNPLSYAQHLYMNGKEVNELVIPDSVTSIGECAFEGCSGLTSVIIPNSVTSIGNGAFRHCSGLTSVSFPNSVISIGDYSFADCSSLTSVIIPNNVTSIYTSIGSSAFAKCSSLTSVIIGDGVNRIGDYAFSHCYGLTSVTIGNSVTLIGGYAFWHCYGITSLTIPNSVTSINEGAFRYCGGLKTVSLGDGIKNIDKYAFGNCDKMQDFYCYAYRYPKTKNDVFQNSYIDYVTLHVPKDAVTQYKAAETWKDFMNVVAITDDEAGVSQVMKESLSVLSDGSTLDVSGADAGTAINVYDTAGRLVGAVKASAGTTTINTTLQSGEIGIVKIGDKAVKVAIK